LHGTEVLLDINKNKIMKEKPRRRLKDYKERKQSNLGIRTVSQLEGNHTMRNNSNFQGRPGL
jgi:hypothetical protein